MKTKFALFDIDDTMYRGDSLFSLYFWGMKKRPACALLLPVMPFAALLYLMKILPRESLKRLYYTPLYAFSEQDYEDFFDECILSRCYPSSIKALRDAKENGFYIIMATASPYAYMRMFESRGLADKVLGTTLKIKNGHYTSKVVGKNCAFKEKAVRIENYIKDTGLTIDYENSVGYSDSDSDIPMLRLVKTAYRVLPGGEICEFKGR